MLFLASDSRPISSSCSKGWLQKLWSKYELYFPIQPRADIQDPSGCRGAVNLDQPFISATFGDGQPNSSATKAPEAPN
jgi:hypothetical protein